MSCNPLNLYVKCSRLVFNVEPSEVWEDCEEFEDELRKLYLSILCKSCESLLIDPVIPKKHHFSCQHRVCLDCIGKKRTTPTNCKMCSDYTLFEKSNQTKLLLRCFQELCELVQSSWIYDYIQRRTNHDTGQKLSPSLIEIIDAGINYGRVSIVLLDDTSSDENSSSSDASKEPLHAVPYSSPVFPNMSPLSPVKPCAGIVQSPQEQFTIIPDPVIPIPALPMVASPPLVSVPQIVQYQSQIVQSQIPSTSKLTPNHQQQSASFIKYPSPMRMTSPSSLVNKPLVPMKIQSTFSSPTPTIYSVMYTGSGNKITLKRKPPDDAVVPVSVCNTMTILKTESTMSSNFKCPPIQINNQQQSLPNLPPAPISTAQNVITATPTTNVSSNPNDPSKRRGCRCGNATAAPGKLTCCGQRCPCYVDSKACIDCKCKGCRNPHYVDGHKKMRHSHLVPDVKQQQIQQQSFLASIQQQTTMVKDIHKSVIPSTSVLKHDDFNIIGDHSALMAKGQGSINNCITIAGMNNGQYQIKQNHPRIIVKEPVKTMSPLIFSGTGMHQPVVTSVNNSNIQILGVYSQVPMMGSDKKIIIKNDQTAVVSFADTTKLLETTASYAGTTNLNTNLL